MKNLTKKILTKTHFIGFAWKAHELYIRIKRKINKNDRSIIEKYFETHETKKLHIGCGGNIIDNWLNSDFHPASLKVLHLDARKNFPFNNGIFDYIFSEHMIEHVSYLNGFKMLKECHRVLKNNGKIRISTPDLRFLIDLYKDDKSESQIEYIKWATEEFINWAPYPDAQFVINNFVRDWGHMFIYDEKTLRAALKAAGFTNVVRCPLNESNDVALQNLENGERMPKSFLELESFTLEATKADGKA